MDRTEAAEWNRDQRDQMVLNMLPLNKKDAVSINDLVENGWHHGTIRLSLKRLIDEKVIQRMWDGNERYGRFLYWAA